MSQEPGIICFAHCNTRRIYCKKIPDFCPICKSHITAYIQEPFRLAYPCQDATQNPCSIAIRPAQGNFLEDFTPLDDLHIAIVDSKGHIYEFDQCGLIINNLSSWNDCLSFNVVPESWYCHWDDVLSELSKSPKWQRNNYDSASMNCFTFVIDFFNVLKYPNLEFCDKESLCRLFVLPKIQETVRYISLHRHLKIKEYYIP